MISVRNLSKSYGSVRAVDDISFDVAAGSIFAFLGTNGAGKSTTISCVTTVLAPDAGTIEVGGKAVGAQDDQDAALRKAWFALALDGQCVRLERCLVADDHRALVGAGDGRQRDGEARVIPVLAHWLQALAPRDA